MDGIVEVLGSMDGTNGSSLLGCVDGSEDATMEVQQAEHSCLHASAVLLFGLLEWQPMTQYQLCWSMLAHTVDGIAKVLGWNDGTNDSSLLGCVNGSEDATMEDEGCLLGSNDGCEDGTTLPQGHTFLLRSA